jgi:hypothetical protein
MFSQRHYEAIASMFAATRPKQQDNLWRDQWEYMRKEFCEALQQDNPKFKPAKFLQATEA